jgi:cobalamin biosynthesis protein CobT
MPKKNEKIEFETDMFGRRNDFGYTNYDESKRLLKWDTGRKSLASWLMGGRGHGFGETSHELKNTAKLTGAMFRVVGVPRGMRYTAKDERSRKSVQVPIKMLKNEQGEWTTEGRKADAFLGACLTNAAMAAMQSESEFNKTMECRNLNSRKFNLKRYMFSLLNQERVMNKFADRFPGYNKFVQKYKEEIYDHQYEPMDPSMDPSLRLLDLVTRLIRFPKHLTEEEFEEFEKPLESIKRQFKKFNGEIPTSSEGCDAMANAISRVIVDFFPDMEEKEEEEEEADPDKESPDAEDGAEAGVGGGADFEEMDIDQMLEGAAVTGKGSSEATPGSGAGGPVNGDIDPDLLAPEPDRAARKQKLEEFAKRLEQQLMSSSEAEEDLSESERKAFDEFLDDMEDQEQMVTDTSGFEGIPVFWDKMPDAKEAYKRSQMGFDMAKANALRNVFKRKAKDYQFIMKGMKSGRFDTNKLAEARQGVQTVYEKIGEVKTNKICVVVLVDQSGSMMGSKIQMAQEAAVFLNEVFGKQPDVELFIYGHMSEQNRTVYGGSTDMFIYREPGHREKHSLGSMFAGGANRDGHAILATAQRVRKFTQNPGIFVVISDGAPAAAGYHNGIEDTREKVLKAEKLNFNVVQIAIEGHVPSERMFNHHVKMTDMKTLPADLVSYMSRRVDKMIRQTVSF